MRTEWNDALGAVAEGLGTVRGLTDVQRDKINRVIAGLVKPLAAPVSNPDRLVEEAARAVTAAQDAARSLDPLHSTWQAGQDAEDALSDAIDDLRAALEGAAATPTADQTDTPRTA